MYKGRVGWLSPTLVVVGSSLLVGLSRRFVERVSLFSPGEPIYLLMFRLGSFFVLLGLWKKYDLRYLYEFLTTFYTVFLLPGQTSWWVTTSFSTFNDRKIFTFYTIHLFQLYIVRLYVFNLQLCPILIYSILKLNFYVFFFFKYFIFLS